MFEKFLEKKTFILNCDVCDARKMKEEDLAAYEQIVINADVLIVNERRGVPGAVLLWGGYPSTETGPAVKKENRKRGSPPGLPLFCCFL